jgi:hypothetical protein
MAAALGTWTSVSQTKPKRLEGHTSNVEAPILYIQYFRGTIGETTEANDTYIIPHKFTSVKFIKAMPLAADVAPTLLYGDGTTIGIFYADAATVTGPTQVTTAATLGASTVVLTSGSAINDVYNNCWLELKYSSGNVQIVKITDYVGATTTATIENPLEEAIATTGTFYTVRGTLMTVNSAAATPSLAFEIVGTFE